MGREWFDDVEEKRNYLCPDYSACLHEAARKNSSSLGCGKCEKKDDQSGQAFTEADLVGILMLLFVIFFPVARKDIPADIDTLKSIFKESLIMGRMEQILKESLTRHPD